MTKGPMSVWVSVQLSPDEKQLLDDAVERERQENILMNRNRFIRRWIATLAPADAD